MSPSTDWWDTNRVNAECTVNLCLALVGSIKTRLSILHSAFYLDNDDRAWEPMQTAKVMLRHAEDALKVALNILDHS